MEITLSVWFVFGIFGQIETSRLKTFNESDFDQKGVALNGQNDNIVIPGGVDSLKYIFDILVGGFLFGPVPMLVSFINQSEE